VQQYEEANGLDGEGWHRINRCIAIEKKIQRKTHLGMLGFPSDEGSVNLETENTGREGSEGGLLESTFDMEYDDKGNPIAKPAPVDIPSLPPLSHSPRSSPQQQPHADNNNKVRQPETNVNAKGVTPVPAMDAAHAVLRKAESTVNAQKTKTCQINTRSAHPLRV
jgi:hypothetical protein